MVARHLCTCFDKSPNLRPPRLQQVQFPSSHQITLSKAQQEQIEQIFNLFDTDGGGTIDKRELDLAMVALGFQGKAKEAKWKNKTAAKMVDDMVADGKVTLDEFSSLMMGQLNMHDPMEKARAVFAVLSRSNGNATQEGLITFDKLHSACLEFKVQHSQPLAPSNYPLTPLRSPIPCLENTLGQSQCMTLNITLVPVCRFLSQHRIFS
jgi:Ca2+-binding EF-hand superfamily protein